MKRMLSGVKPTGRLTLGNYIGAISQFVAFQDEYDLYIFIANMHAITVPQDSAAHRTWMDFNLPFLYGRITAHDAIQG